MQPDEMANFVVLTIKSALATALGPVTDRLAAAEARLNVLGDVRDRVVTIEAKSSAVILPPIPEPVDLAPMLERIAAIDARLSPLSDVRDRVLAMEAKASVPIATVTPPEPARVDLTPIMERLATADTRLTRLVGLETTVKEVCDRLLTMETKAAAVPEPVASGPTGSDLELHIRSAIEPVTKTVSALQERIAVMEVRAQVPGPAGKDGQNGQNGKDGADGMGWDDLAVKHDGERTFTVELVKGERVKTAGTFTIPAMIYRGVYQRGKSYELGDTVSFGNQLWHCNAATDTPPGEGSKLWQLCVRKGQDGRDGKDAVTVPVVSVGRTQ